MLRLAVLLGASGLTAAAAPLLELNIDPATVITTGLGDSADFAHQFHVAFAKMVSGACVFSGQPFNCAIAGNAGDSLAWHARILAKGGAASSAKIGPELLASDYVPL